MVFVGPSPESITEMGLKHRAREVAQAANVPVIAGTGLLATAAEALEAAERLKYPVRTIIHPDPLGMFWIGVVC